MADQEKEKSQELGLIDITEILSDYLRIFRRIVGMGADLYNSGSRVVLCAGETTVSAGVHSVSNIYCEYTERTAGYR